MRRVLLCVALGAVLTLASVWLPGAFISGGKFQSVRASRISDPSEFPSDLACLFLTLDDSLAVTWMDAWASTSLGELLKPVSLRGPGPEDITHSWARREAWPRMLAELQAVAPMIRHRIVYETRGWPCRALWCEHGYSEPRSRWTVVRGAFELTGSHRALPSPGASFSRTLPYLPTWPGLVINLAFWSAATAQFVFAPALVRRLRRRPGLCPACSYDLRGLPAGSACPECGRGSPTSPRGQAETAVQERPYGHE